MNEQLKLLVELQKLDTVILSDRSKIDSIPARISSEEGPFKKAEAAYDNAKQRHESLEKKKKDREREIYDINEKIKKMKQRSSEIKNNKEYQAHLKEIERAEKDLRTAEDGPLTIMESLEESSKHLKVEIATIEKEKARIELIKKDLEKEVLTCEGEVKKLKEQRKLLVDKIDADIYEHYKNRLKASRGLAVVAAKDEICQGCNIHIPPQLFVEIKNNDELINCPQCRRILYYVKQDTVRE